MANYHPVLHSYNEIRLAYQFFNNAKDVIPPESVPEVLHSIRIAARNVYRRPVYDPLRVPLTGGWRHVYDDDYEGGKHFCLLPDRPEDPYTDDEIREYIEDSDVYYGRVNSPYDCTGKRFTRWISWKRTPAGIALIHSWGLDI